MISKPLFFQVQSLSRARPFPAPEKIQVNLEAAVLADGYVWHSQSESKKITMSSSSSSSIPLWETDLVWYSPIPAYSLFTTPGINYTTTGMQTCSDTQLRWAMSWVVNECRKGGTITSKSIWEKYLTTLPSSYPATDPRYEFVIIFTAEPTFTSATGRTSSYNHGQASPPNQPKYNAHSRETISVVRKGKLISITKPSKKDLAAKPTASPKYSDISKPQFLLSSSALPPGSSPELVEVARRAFAKSVSVSTQNQYNAAYNHLLKAEVLLGEKFNNPPTQAEITYFTSYLISQNLTKSTISNYMSGLRFVMLSRGNHSSLPRSDLTSQLLAGSANG